MAKRRRIPVTRSRWVVVEVDPRKLVPTLERLGDHLEPYLPLFGGRSERRENAGRAIKGLLSGLPRKSVEPIAEFSNQPRRALQEFVGAGDWDDAALIDRLVTEVAEELGLDDGMLIVDPSSFPNRSFGVRPIQTGPNELCERILGVRGL